MKSLYEEHRPRCWSQVVGQSKAINRIQILARRGLAGRAYWISGQSGTGKTTMARLLASEIADELNIDEIDATGLSAAKIAEIDRKSAGYCIGSKLGRVLIVNESHGLNRAAIRQLLVTLERIPGHVAWIFTTTCDGQASLFDEQIDAHPLLSRCIEVALSRRDLAKPFAERARSIAQAEGLDGQPIEKYIKLCQSKKNNLRAVLQEIEAGAMLEEVAQ